MVIMSPGDERDLELMIPWALAHDHPTAIRYPKATWSGCPATRPPIELGKSPNWSGPGADGALIASARCCSECLQAAAKLAVEGIDLAVINARFVKPLDTRAILQAVREQPFVVTVEEGCLMGGFGSAVLEAANDAGLTPAIPPPGNSRPVCRACRTLGAVGRAWGFPAGELPKPAANWPAWSMSPRWPPRGVTRRSFPMPHDTSASKWIALLATGGFASSC